MKRFIGMFVIMLTLFSCKKAVIEQPQPHEKSTYRVLAIGADTTISTSMFARIETVGLLLVEDSKLKAELIAYSGNNNGTGVYTIKVTNKQSCQVIILWHWEDLLINTISPSSDVIPANGVVTFTLTGEAKTGKIMLQSEGDCGNSSSLIIKITNDILPITFINNSTNYNSKTGQLIVSFNIDDPSVINWFIIQKLNNKLEWVQAALIQCDKKTKSYNIPL